MGYLRLWRRKTIVPGLRMNLSKSGISWSLGPRGAHFTIGPHGARSTVGIPGTGVYYTSYSGRHAHRAVQSRAQATSRPAATTNAAAPPNSIHREPMLPSTKVALGVVLCLLGFLTILAYIGVGLLIVGGIFIADGLAQRNKTEWKIRALLRRARSHPQQSETLLTQALATDPANPEALAAMADWRFDNSQWSGAADFFEKYLQHAPGDWLAEGHAANAWLNAGNADAAIPHFLHVRELPFLTDDIRASITAGLAMCYLRKGEAHQALDVAKSAPLQRHNLGDGLQQCLFVRAMAHYGAGQRSQGVSDLDRLASINSEYPSLNAVRSEMLTGAFNLNASIPPAVDSEYGHGGV